MTDPHPVDRVVEAARVTLDAVGLVRLYDALEDMRERVDALSPGLPSYGELAEAVLESADEALCVPEHKRCYAENLCVAAAARLRNGGDDA